MRRSVLAALLFGLAATAFAPPLLARGTDNNIPAEALDVTAHAHGDFRDAKPVTARRAMVVSAQHLATRVGVDILKRGGNAIDAAVAVGYALAVVHPCCGNIGGGGFMTIHLADGRNLFLNFREKAPLKATPTMFQDENGNVVPGRSTDTYLAVGVPGDQHLGLVSRPLRVAEEGADQMLAVP